MKKEYNRNLIDRFLCLFVGFYRFVGTDVSNVEDMSEMFYKASAFNQSLTNWNISKVENMRRMFYKAHSFNQSLGQWDISRVEDRSEMFGREGDCK